jgi:hypothetical protein
MISVDWRCSKKRRKQDMQMKFVGEFDRKKLIEQEIYGQKVNVTGSGVYWGFKCLFVQRPANLHFKNYSSLYFL